MHIFIKTLTGRTCELSISESSSVSSLYTQIEKSTGISSEDQTLIFNGKTLESIFNISDYGITDSSELHLTVDLDGGKGKKKKKDTKKRKPKHKKRKVKLAILKYYKVENGKAVAIRQNCKFCPAGTFIADHEDRLYCGRCHQTYEKTEITKKVKKEAPKKEVVEEKDEKGGKKKGKK